MGPVAVVALALAWIGATQVNAGTLTYAGSFTPPAFPSSPLGGQDITYHPASGHLFLVNSAGEGSTILEVTTSGFLVDSIWIQSGEVSGLQTLPNGNLLAAEGGLSGRYLLEFTTRGLQVAGGIALDVGPVTIDMKGAALHPGTNTLFLVDDDADQIDELALDGTLLRSISTPALDTTFQDPEGITVNPATGRLLVVNDLGPRRGLRELALDGTLVTYYELGGPNGFQDPNGASLDPEGVAMDGTMGTVYVSFHQNRGVGIYVLDSDGDGRADGTWDNCALEPNPDQRDSDGDGLGDVCDPEPGNDADADGFVDWLDNCPLVANADQRDSDADGLGDVCDPQPGNDADADGVVDWLDNCPSAANSDQRDSDSDGVGDVCDPQPGNDADADGIVDWEDNCVLVANPPTVRLQHQTTTGAQLDDDADGVGNRCDADFNHVGGPVDSADFAMFRGAYGLKRSSVACSGAAPGLQPCDIYDLNGQSGVIDSADFAIFRSLFGTKTGPSCAACPLACEGDACAP